MIILEVQMLVFVLIFTNGRVPFSMLMVDRGERDPEVSFLVVDLVLCSGFALHCKKLPSKNRGNYPSLHYKKA